jgi:hypothetical protein
MARYLDLREPTIQDVEAAERAACGHIDYSNKFAYGVAKAMRREKDA